MMACPTCGGVGTVSAEVVNAMKDRCPHGHPYDSANTYVNPRGWRLCRTCRRHDAERRRGGMALRVMHYALGGVSSGGADG